jgi:hypothetical protein
VTSDPAEIPWSDREQAGESLDIARSVMHSCAMSDELIDGGDERQTTFRPSRRKVLVAAAWTVPVVIVGSAAPALADSSAPVSVGTWGPFCKHTGNGAFSGSYHFASTWTSSFNPTTVVTINSITVNGTVFTTGLTPSSITFNGPTVNQPVIFHLNTGSNANANVSIAYTVNGHQYTAGTGGTRNTPTCSSQNITN